MRSRDVAFRLYSDRVDCFDSVNRHNKRPGTCADSLVVLLLAGTQTAAIAALSASSPEVLLAKYRHDVVVLTVQVEEV